MKYKERHNSSCDAVHLCTCSGGCHWTEVDNSSSGDDSDANDFFGSSSESEPKRDSELKPKLDNGHGQSEAVTPASRSQSRNSSSASEAEDKYSYSSKTAPEDEKRSETSSGSPTASSSSEESSDENSDDEAESDNTTTDRSSKASSASLAVEVKLSKKQTQKSKAKQNKEKQLGVSLLELYPKSLSLVGLSSEKKEIQTRPLADRPKSSASARPSLQTRVLSRSRSLEEFTASLPERLKQKGWNMDTTELMRLNKAVYEAWYFHKEEEEQMLKKEAAKKELENKMQKPRKKTVPRKTRKIKMSEKIKMKIDKEDPGWDWMKEKLVKMKNAKFKTDAKAKEEREVQEKRKASKVEEGALAYAAWKTRKDEIAQEKRRKEKKEARERARAEEENAQENRISAEKVFEQYKERVTAEQREETLRLRRRQRRLADRTARLLETRDRQAEARYHQWLREAAERASAPPDSADRHTPPPPRPPWYPGGLLAGRPATEPPPAPARSARPASALRTGGARGWRPCHQTHCPACPCAPPAAEVVSSSRPDVRLAVDQPLTCASRRAVFVVRCLFCELQYVGWTLQSIRAAFARQLRALREEAGSTLADHIAEHRRNSERFVPLTECLELTGVRAFPETASRHAVTDFAHVTKEILGTISPDGINRA
ncbi:microtubule-associated protein 9-like isoform X2 [Amphibalanus amphitrite]|uniref:microtubule-associated protein 9-like isoform X2 n=1 Tax=Amphibalanus amphitrite TaxID=1232801 RepID=UPI001C91A1AE|nr:microtubule-associated protein 9-like isoform X2 [Amphibalanus amphitrite]XP_043217304.1 microtubule-associated protein 9-like isoform X2 [Amphibalanus amphitrite]